MGAARQFDGGRLARIDDDDRIADRKPVIGNIGERARRTSGRLIIAQNGCKLVGKRCRGAVEQGQIAILVTEEADRREHAVDGRHKPRRHVMTEIDITLTKRQEIQQQLQHDARITRDMPTIGQDLPLHLLVELSALPGDLRRAVRHGDGRHGKRDADFQTYLTIRHIFGNETQIADMQADAF